MFHVCIMEYFYIFCIKKPTHCCTRSKRQYCSFQWDSHKQCCPKMYSQQIKKRISPSVIFFSVHRAFVQFIRSILSFSLLSKNPHHQTVHQQKAVEAFHRLSYRYALFRVITDKSVNFTNNCAESYTFAYELRRLQV